MNLLKNRKKKANMKQKPATHVNRGHYQSIHDLPIFIWDKVNSTSEYKMLQHNLNGKINEVTLENIWGKIYDEWIAEFDFAPEKQIWEDLIKEAAQLRTDAMSNNDYYLNFLADVKQKEADAMVVSPTGPTLGNRAVKIEIDLKLGFPIDVMNTSVYKFCNYERTIKERNG